MNRHYCVGALQMAFTSNVDIYVQLQRTLHGSLWKASTSVLPTAFRGDGDKEIVLMTTGAHHYLIAIDYGLRIYSRFGDNRASRILSTLSDFIDVTMRNIPPQVGATDCGPMCIYYAEFLVRHGDSIFTMRRWPLVSNETVSEAVLRIRTSLQYL